MGRARMICDDFWTDPDLVDLTTEQRTALLLFLTSRESNVIGVYRAVWRAIGAGMGWTHDQVLNAARDLKAKGCLDLNQDTGWLWVKPWWKHNSIRGAFTGNVAKKAAQELAQVPDFWAESVRDWILANDPEGACKGLLSPLQGAGGNPTTIVNRISTPTTKDDGGGENIDDIVQAAVWASGNSVAKPAAYASKIRARIEREGPSQEDLLTLQNWRKFQVSEHLFSIARKLPQGEWNTDQGSRVKVTGETGPVEVFTRSGEQKSLPREAFVEDLIHGRVRLVDADLDADLTHLLGLAA